jgi:co-chaperonin GroES (HSP10)
MSKTKKQDLNESGIYPAGNRVLVFVDQIEEKVKDTVIELLADTIEAQQSSNASGVVIAIGPDAFQHVTEKKYRNIDGELRLAEVSKRGYSQPFAVPGDRISFAKFAGMKYLGKDNKRYLVINDEDITCKLDEEVELTDLKIREGVGL